MKRFVLALAIAALPASAIGQGPPSQPHQPQLGTPTSPDALKPLPEVKLQGFMMPLEMGDKQKQFVLTAMPQSCAFCLPGGPEQLVLVQAKAPVKYTMEPVILSGKLAVLKDDPNGLYYRLDNAVLTTAK